MLFIKKFPSAVFIAMLALMPTACDSNDAIDEDDQQRGSVSLQISGDKDASFEGFAFFGEAEDPETGEDVFLIYFSETETVTGEAGRYGFIGRNSGRPGTGTYSVVDVSQDNDDIPDDQFVMVATLGSTESGAVSYVSQGGEVTFTRSSSDRLKGSFEVSAAGFQFTGGEGQELDVAIEGSFDAVGNDNIFVPFSP